MGQLLMTVVATAILATPAPGGETDQGAAPGDGNVAAEATPGTGNPVMVPTGEPCPGDLNGCGCIGFPDLVIVLQSWGPCAGCLADIDEDGFVGFPDMLVVLSGWGPCP